MNTSTPRSSAPLSDDTHAILLRKWDEKRKARHLRGLPVTDGFIRTACNPGNLKVTLAAVEDLPFERSSFDVTLGSVFLHFADKERAVRGMMRVTRSGGIVAVLAPARVTRPAFFRDWFWPFFKAAGSKAKAQSELFHEPGEVAALFSATGLKDIQVEQRSTPAVFADPEAVVQHYVTGVNAFQEVLEEMPWAARQQLIEETTERGREIYSSLPLSERTIQVALEFVKGRVP